MAQIDMEEWGEVKTTVAEQKRWMNEEAKPMLQQRPRPTDAALQQVYAFATGFLSSALIAVLVAYLNHK